MPRDTKLILCPINLRHTKLDDSAYQEAVDIILTMESTYIQVLSLVKISKRVQRDQSDNAAAGILDRAIDVVDGGQRGRAERFHLPSCPFYVL